MFTDQQRTMMAYDRPVYLCLISLLLCFAACRENRSAATEPTANHALDKDTLDSAPSALAQIPDWASPVVAALADSFRLDDQKILEGDFNADLKNDMACLVEQRFSHQKGVLIIHQGPEAEYFLFGAGRMVNGMKDLSWIEVFTTLPRGEEIAPTLVDTLTGDIVGEDASKRFTLVGEGIYMHVDEASGGGILFWTGNKYEWYHLE
jgi:hypothetical protein